MPFHLEILWSDVLIGILLVTCLLLILWGQTHAHWCEAWRRVLNHSLGMMSLVILMTYLSIAVLDTIHLHFAQNYQGRHSYSLETKSVLDILLAPIGQQEEKTYSAPFATELYAKETVILPNGQVERIYPRLQYGGANLTSPLLQQSKDVIKRSILASLKAILCWSALAVAFVFWQMKKTQKTFFKMTHNILLGQTDLPWRVFLATTLIVFLISVWSIDLGKHYHILGTNKIGQDVFYLAIKSVRTDLLIGLLTIGIMLPFAIFLGMAAGYFRGVVDDVVQYIYTTLSSVPAVLLIAAAILSLQIYIANHPHYFQTLAVRSDVRLLALCAILGVTEWTSLCRLLRGETLKLREMAYIQAAVSLGVRRSRILLRHIFPNVLHIILITVVLDFSGLILAEAVLSYLGIGVDPNMQSWGNMINAARLEMAREPIVWWPLFSAFIWMFTLVIAANLFADAVRDAFDPRNKK